MKKKYKYRYISECDYLIENRGYYFLIVDNGKVKFLLKSNVSLNYLIEKEMLPKEDQYAYSIIQFIVQHTSVKNLIENR